MHSLADVWSITHWGKRISIAGESPSWRKERERERGREHGSTMSIQKYLEGGKGRRRWCCCKNILIMSWRPETGREGKEGGWLIDWFYLLKMAGAWRWVFESLRAAAEPASLVPLLLAHRPTLLQSCTELPPKEVALLFCLLFVFCIISCLIWSCFCPHFFAKVRIWEPNLSFVLAAIASSSSSSSPWCGHFIIHQVLYDTEVYHDMAIWSIHQVLHGPKLLNLADVTIKLGVLHDYCTILENQEHQQ